MDSSITINIVEPGGTPVVPNTGLFTNGIGLPEAAIISTCAIFILSIIAAIIYRKKHHKDYSRLTAAFHSLLDFIRSRKQAVATLSIIAIVTFVGTFAILLSTKDTDKGTNALGADNLTVTVDNVNATIEVADKPVFAVVPVTVTVAEPTEAGYTLSAYIDSTNLISSANSTDKIPMIVTEEADLSSLADNTWGLSNVPPTSEQEDVYYPLSNNTSVPTIITDKNYKSTEENDVTTIYYAFYITPDMPTGTYNSAAVTYAATRNKAGLSSVIFDGNGLYFNDDEGQNENIVRYEIASSDYTSLYSQTPNISVDGIKEEDVTYGIFINDVVTIPGASSLKIQLTYGGGLSPDDSHDYGYLSFWQGAHPDYRANINYQTGIQSCGSSTTTDGKYNTTSGYGTEDNNETVECTITGDSVTFDFWTEDNAPGHIRWYGYYATVTGYDASGRAIHLKGNTSVVGDYLTPSSDIYFRFLGWSENPEAKEPEYVTEEDIKTRLKLSPDATIRLYAVWDPNIRIIYEGNNASSATNMRNVIQYAYDYDHRLVGKQVNLLASNFSKNGYGFAGWSTDAEAWDHLTDDDESNNPIIYGPNQMITIDENLITEAGKNRKLVLNAVWVPAETDASGNPISLQDWQGCSALTPTTYNTETGQLTVGKNTITALTDSRDGNIYTVARLADGNCWMTENLRLDNEATISTANTNNPVVVDGNVAIKNNDGSTTNHLSPNRNFWCASWGSAECQDQSYLNTNNITKTATSPYHIQDFTNDPHQNFNSNIFSYGAYYNWYSATAGNGTYTTGEQSVKTVSGDICPASWSLPIGGETTNNGSFWNLNAQMGSKQYSQEGSRNWRAFPNNFIYSGYFVSSLPVDSVGNYGFYWSSTAVAAGYAYSASLNSDTIEPGTDYSNGYVGYSVRCVLVTE